VDFESTMHTDSEKTGDLKLIKELLIFSKYENLDKDSLE